MSGVITAVAAAGLVGAIGGAYIASEGTEDAANIQAGSANQANQLGYQMFQEQKALMQPWVQSGQENLGRLNTAMQPGGNLDPNYRFSTQDWQNSPEYAVYAGARDAATKRSQEALMAQGAASGMYGSGTMANQLAQNMGQLYAQYDPQSLQAAQQSVLGQRNTGYNMLAGMSSPQGAQQVAGFAGQYGQQAGQNMIGAGNAQAAGQVGAANAWSNALTSGTNQIANAYGQYQGQQNFNQLMNLYQQNPYQYGQNNVPISSQYGTTGYEQYGWD
jgi:hypothetical protein